MDLSVEAKTLLGELRGRPEWIEIMKYLETDKMPRYKPRDDKDYQAQSQNWVFYSGCSHENDRIIKLLTGER